MKIHKIAGLVWFICSPLCFAEGEAGQIKFDTLLGYKNVVVIKVEPDGIRIVHSDGVKKIPYEQLPDDLKKKFGFTEQGAMQYRQLAKEKEKLIAEAEIAAAKAEELQSKAEFSKRELKGEIYLIRPDGLVLEYVVVKTNRFIEQQIPYTAQVDGPNAFHPEKEVKTETRFKTERVQVVQSIHKAFIKCNPKPWADKKATHFEGIVYEIGEKTYDFLGTNSALYFSVDPKDAIERL